MQTGATIHTSSIPSLAGATDTTSADDDCKSTENGSEYGLDVNFWKTINNMTLFVT